MHTYTGASLVVQRGKESASNVGDPGLISQWENPLEKEMATHASVLAWRIPRTEEPGRRKESDTT